MKKLAVVLLAVAFLLLITEAGAQGVILAKDVSEKSSEATFYLKEKVKAPGELARKLFSIPGILGVVFAEEMMEIDVHKNHRFSWKALTPKIEATINKHFNPTPPKNPTGLGVVTPAK